MGLIDPVVQELQLESVNTRRVLERVPEERAEWRPHPKSWTMMELASHLADIPGWVGGILDVDVFDLETDGKGYQPFQAATVADLLSHFDQATATAVERLKDASDEQLMQTWQMKAGGAVKLSAPRIGVIKSMLINHAIQHRGQLTVYLRLTDAKVPAIYGPSADETGD